MLKFFKILFLLMATSTLSAQLIECQRLREILPLIDEDTLVVFNINNVLTFSSQDAGSTPWAEEHIARISTDQKLTKPHATNVFIPLWHEILIATDVKLFDPEGEAIIHYLQNNKIKTMALTNRYVEMGYPTHHQLRSVGIDFAKNPPFPEDFFIQGTESPSKYIEGIIFNGLINFKGDTLAAFLKNINYFPKKLIYIEDKPKHLAQVEQVITALGIPFVGVHFGALELQRQSYRSELAALQVKFHFDILDDASAKKLYYDRLGISPTQDAVPSNEHFCFLPPGIRRIGSIEDIQQDLIPQALLVTELDHVLWNTQGSIGASAFLEHTKDKYLSLGNTSKAAQRKAESLVEKIHRRAQVSLIEEKSIDFFKNLPSQQCWSIALSFRPKGLLQRTSKQMNHLGLSFHSPFEAEGSFLPQGIICGNQDERFKEFEEKLAALAVKPTVLMAVSANLADLIELQKIAAAQDIKFQGYFYRPTNAKPLVLDDGVLSIELEYLDHLLSNEDATILLKQ